MYGIAKNFDRDEITKIISKGDVPISTTDNKKDLTRLYKDVVDLLSLQVMLYKNNNFFDNIY